MSTANRALPLARTYRPALLSELIGQPGLTRTLTNAFEQGRIAQAYLFTGTRGVGKTTTARILARALNCEQGPTATPCGTCQQCTAIAAERHMDVLEMDAASRTQVDNIRELIDQLPYRPVMGRYKILVLDEVHMLSRNAFNALLKTLEEPPEHIVFIFATTEVRKLPPTILSRCQRFDLRRVSEEQLAGHVREIAAREGVGIDQDAVEVVARAGDGSVRDTLSILDQAISMGGGRVSGHELRQSLGLVERQQACAILDAALAGQPGEALKTLRGVLAGGADVAALLKDMLSYAHQLCLGATAPETLGDAGLTPGEVEAVSALGRKLGARTCEHTWGQLMQAVPDVQAAPAPEQVIEIAVLRVAGSPTGSNW
ncbi:DNA polymerase III subunit gamma/tau [Rhodovibrio sodomensis]|nr:DNA polymerase III subunit gamma/tau [Rhodovibrio sodomensis]